VDKREERKSKAKGKGKGQKRAKKNLHQHMQEKDFELGTWLVEVKGKLS
jgi:hypothetical protein